MAKPPSPPPGQQPGSPDRRALLQAFQDVVRTEQEKQSQSSSPEPSTTRWGFLASMGLLVAGLVAVLLLQPTWLYSKAPEETPALREASLRVRMFVEIDRVGQYQARMGHLPKSLTEVGADTTGLTYLSDSTGFSLTGRSQGLSLTYESTTPARDFLGNSYTQISQRRRK